MQLRKKSPYRRLSDFFFKIKKLFFVLLARERLKMFHQLIFRVFLNFSTQYLKHYWSEEKPSLVNFAALKPFF